MALNTRKPGARRYALTLLVAALSLAVLLVGCQGSPAKDPDSPEAFRKALELQDKLEEKGLRAPHTDTLVQLYGTDGGVAVMYADSDFQKYYNLVHFGNTGYRPGHLDPDVVAYDEAVLEVYAPEKLPAYREMVEDWETRELIP